MTGQHQGQKYCEADPFTYSKQRQDEDQCHRQHAAQKHADKVIQAGLRLSVADSGSEISFSLLDAWRAKIFIYTVS